MFDAWQVTTDAASLRGAVHRHVRSTGTSSEQQWNLQTAASKADLMAVERENGDLDVVTSDYKTTLPTYSKLYQTLQMASKTGQTAPTLPFYTLRRRNH